MNAIIEWLLNASVEQFILATIVVVIGTAILIRIVIETIRE